ncbi:von Willebrand factor type A domain protein [Actinobaculum sp. oral taxon 183 str. F0552]|jgi:putative von willebrand factor type A domain protein|nr:von Willebrand factor type A domain protein [Actinobaculum sp. oral taxon 183 str. F0552]
MMMWLWPRWAVAALLVGGLGACFALWRTTRGDNSKAWVDWTRRALMIVVVASMGMTPSVEVKQTSVVRGANVYFVVDVTGSMVAEDYNGSHPRMDGVRADIRRIQRQIPGARYSAFVFGSEATRALPLTTDGTALESFVQTLSSENTYQSEGSSVRRPVEALRRELERSRRSHPEALQLVYVLSDGEPRGRDSGEKGYSEVHDLIDGGAVLGYGTSQGGRMKENLGGDPAKSGYIVDPKTKSEAISRIDEGQLKKAAKEAGVDYVHRTSPDQGITTPDVDTLKQRSAKGRTRRNPMIWPAGTALVVLLAWEIAALTPRIRLRVRGR